MFEAITRCYWQEFQKWLKNEEMEYRLEPLSHTLAELRSTFDVENFNIESPVAHDKLQVNTV